MEEGRGGGGEELSHAEPGEWINETALLGHLKGRVSCVGLDWEDWEDCLGTAPWCIPPRTGGNDPSILRTSVE